MYLTHVYIRETEKREELLKQSLEMRKKCDKIIYETSLLILQMQEIISKDK